MWTLFDSPAFAPFVVAGMVLLILLAVEMLGFFFGGLSGVLENIVPDSLVDADFDADASFDSGDLSLGLKALDWLYVGRIPTMILLILFIGSFCITGIVIQQISLSVLGNYLSPWLASFDALVISIPVLKGLAALLYPILPKDETSAVSGESLVGRPAKIILGSASIGHPAQAKITDEHGQAHYVMVEPDPDYLETLENQDQQDRLFIESKSESEILSQAISNPNELAVLDFEDTLVITQKIGERYLVKRLS